MHPRSHFSSISRIKGAEILLPCFISKFNTEISLLPVFFPVVFQPCLVETLRSLDLRIIARLSCLFINGLYGCLLSLSFPVAHVYLRYSGRF